MNLPPETRGFFTYLSSFGMSSYPDEVTAAGCLNWIAQMDYSLIRTWGVLEEEIQGGTGALLDRVVESSKAEHRLGSPVASVEQSKELVKVTTRSGEVITASHVVVATPMACWTDIAFKPALNAPKVEASNEHHVARPLKVWALVKNAPPFPFKIAEPETANGAWEMHTEYDMGEDGQIMVGYFIQEVEGSRGFTNTFDGVQEFVSTMFLGAELVEYESHDWLADEFAKKR